MCKCINIVIKTDDMFFLSGLKEMLLHQFSTHTWKVCFISTKDDGHADILILDEIYSYLFPCGNIYGPRTVSYSSIITVKNLWPRRRVYTPPCHRHIGMIDKQSQPGDVMRLIERGLALSNSTDCVHKCSYCTPNLSSLEKLVLEYIAAEIPICGIARLLQLSSKTVSTHKLAAMRKLGLKYNHELYHWLRQGYFIKPRKEPLSE